MMKKHQKYFYRKEQLFNMNKEIIFITETKDISLLKELIDNKNEICENINYLRTKMQPTRLHL